METAITALIIIGVMILAIVGLSERALLSQSLLSDSSRVLQERLGDRARTSLMSLGGTTTSQGNNVVITLRNTGQTRLANFNHWDVILLYTDLNSVYHAQWYPSNNWTKTIYLSAASQTPEVIEPGIFDPGEEVVITVNVSPAAVKAGTTNLATVAVPNGIAASTVFTR